MSIRSVVTVIITALGLAVLSAGPAFAHAELIGSSPAADSSVASVTEVSVTAGEELLNIGENAEGFVIAVSDADGAFYGDGCVSVQGDTASMDVKLSLRGTYTVAYRVISDDGHPVEGSFTFDFEGDANESNLVRYVGRPVCGETPVTLVDETTEPTEPTEPSVISTAPPIVPPAPGADLTPWIGLATIPLVVGAIWILIRLLGKKDSEDNLV
ncbi:MAG: copper resistance protein CopC [Microbacteriaceae bacterium]|nr:copper resistance protein CopC [Microbacteriaceae bacterium]